LTDIAAIAGGDSYTIGLKNDGTVWTWGKDYDGNLGNNDSSNITFFPVQVCATAGASPGTCGTYLTGITAIEGSGEDGWMQSTIALRYDGTVWAWGNNMYGQLGNNSTVSSTIPVQVCATAGASAGTCGSYLTGVTAISAGEDGFTIALKNDGSVWAWGANFDGQLGNNYRFTNSRVPVQVCATAGASWGTCNSYLAGVTAIAAGSHHAAVLKDDGTVWTWGGNDCGDLGHNNTGKFGAGESQIPVQVCATAGASEDSCGSYLTGITAVTAGSGHTGALKNDGTVWTWGCNGYYVQLGNNSTTSSPIPVQVCATAGTTAGTCGSYLAGITALSDKFNQPVALKNDGTVWEWGNIAVQSTVSGPGSVLAPSGVTTGAPGSTTINITWTASPGASAYNLYWSTQSNISPLTGTRILLGNVTNYAHAGRAVGTRYYYVVTAVDSIGNESTGSRVATSVAQ
jgi:alpha-tubulin suppressor-like RCC1 family protein